MKTEAILIFKYIRVILPFIWVGLICAISFMEAWVKFTPPDVSFTTGLSIGKAVFSALNKVELVVAILVAIALLSGTWWNWHTEIFYLIAVGILFTQSIWVLPYLAARIDIYLTGSTPPPSPVHFYFVMMEATKTIALVIYGIKQLALWKT